MFKQIWGRIWLRRVRFNSQYQNLDWLYRVKDPWNLNSEKEQARFAEVNSIIEELVPHCQDLLELGCGEGFQSVFLQKVTKNLVGIDVSRVAIERAKSKCPLGSFYVGQAEEIQSILSGRTFDLITACEVLYYSSNIPSTITNLQKLTDRILVTNYRERALKMEEYFSGPGWRNLDPIHADGSTWHVCFWDRHADDTNT